MRESDLGRSRPTPQEIVANQREQMLTNPNACMRLNKEYLLRICFGHLLEIISPTSAIRIAEWIDTNDQWCDEFGILRIRSIDQLHTLHLPFKFVASDHGYRCFDSHRIAPDEAVRIASNSSQELMDCLLPSASMVDRYVALPMPINDTSVQTFRGSV